jgi:hypothetical protein
MEREDVSRTNHSQMIPYLSQEAGKYKAVYDKVKTVLADLFEWLRQWVGPLKQIIDERGEADNKLVARE